MPQGGVPLGCSVGGGGVRLPWVVTQAWRLLAAILRQGESRTGSGVELNIYRIENQGFWSNLNKTISCENTLPCSVLMLNIHLQ